MGPLALLPGGWGLLAGQSCSPRPPAQHCSPRAPVPLATCPPSHAAFLCLCPPAAQEEAEKVEFLRAVSSLCRAPRDQGFLEKLKEFCEQYEVVENIKVRGQAAGLGKGQAARRQHTVRTHRARAGGGQGPACAGRR